jgi:integrase
MPNNSAPKRAPRTPKYCLHKPTGQARVILAGQHIYLGTYGSPEAEVRYKQIVAEFLATGLTPAMQQAATTTKPGATITIAELLSAYLTHADTYYRAPDGKPTSELHCVKLALRPLRELYELSDAAKFGPLALQAVRQAMIEKRWSRKNINRAVSRVVRMFRWASQNELVPPSLYHGLRSVEGLKAGRSEAKETKPVKPVPQAYIDAVLALVSPPVGAVIRLQLLTGARPGELLGMRACGISMVGPVWTYTPAAHKNAWRGHGREIYLGPQAQAIVREFLKPSTEAFLFDPREGRAAFLATIPNRKPLSATIKAKRKAKRKKVSRKPRERYSVETFQGAIKRACIVAKVPHWHPHQLRHTAGTHLRREYGLEVARTVLGHKSVGITEHYAEQDRERAVEVMRRIG